MTHLNDRLLDVGVRRAIYVQRFGTAMVNDVTAFLEEHVFSDLLGAVVRRLARIRARGYDSGVHTTKQYLGLLHDVSSIVLDGTKEARKIVVASARELAKAESGWALRAMQRETPGLGIEFRGLNVRAAQQVVNQGIRGRTVSDWFDSLGADLQKRLEEQVGVGLAQGETNDQLIRRIRGTRAQRFGDGLLQVTRRQAESIVRTTANHVSTQAREQTYRENSDVIKGVQWVSTLDSRTTDICKGYDGKVFEIGEGPRPPAHWGCRSTTVPITKSLRQMGIQAKDVPESTRASVNGQVPDRLSYGDWLRRQPASVQNEALGAGRARLFRAGKIKVEDLTGPTGRPVTLAQLRAAE